MEALDSVYVDANSARCAQMLKQERRRCQWCNATLSIYHGAGEDKCWPCQNKEAPLSDATVAAVPLGRNKPWDARYAMVRDEMRLLRTFSGRMLHQRLGMDWPVIARALLQAVGQGEIEHDGPSMGQKSRYRWIGK